MGSLPGVWGFGSAKAPADCLAYRAVGRVSFDVSCGASPPASRVHVTCSCANTQLTRPSFYHAQDRTIYIRWSIILVHHARWLPNPHSYRVRKKATELSTTPSINNY